MDQMTALRWVRQHISVFGGDPDNVTVAGQSAGAHSIWAMMAWGESRTLFDRAVLMSYAALPLQSEAVAHTTAAQFLSMLDRPPLSATDRRSVVLGKSVTVRVALDGSRYKKKTSKRRHMKYSQQKNNKKKKSI